MDNFRLTSLVYDGFQRAKSYFFGFGGSESVAQPYSSWTTVRNNNPTLREDVFDRVGEMPMTGAATMTLSGTVQKTSILLLVLMASAVLGWSFPIGGLAIGMIFAALILAFVIAFNPARAKTLSLLYAAVKGYPVGVLSVVVATQLQSDKNPWISNAVPVAIMGTMLTLGVMLFLYAKRIIRLSETMKAVIIGATIAVGITYLGVFLLSFIFPKLPGGMAIFQSGPIGIGFSIFVIALAAFNFLVDFDFIETGIQRRAPEYMEWYAGFGLLVTIVWLYIEILRLLSKLNRR